MTTEKTRVAPKSVTETHFTREQAAEYLGITSRTLIRWEQLAEGPPITRLGRKILYRKKSVRQWVNDQEFVYEEV